MFVSILVLGLALSVCYGGTISSLETEIAQLFERVKPSVPTVVYMIGDREFVSTGIVMDKQGHILTTKDFPGDPTSVEVQFPLSNRTAQFMGFDRESKLAVLKVDPAGLVPAKIGNSDKIAPPTWIMIVGNSMGISPAAATGLIGGKRADDGLFQINASINPGNSGAGVFNSGGELIGILSSTLARPFYISVGSGEKELRAGAELLSRCDLPVGGSGLMVPINHAAELMNEIVEHGTINYGWLGVRLQALDSPLKKATGAERGVLVSEIIDGGPAEQAGFKEGDVVVKYDGKPVDDMHQFTDTVRKTKPGTSINVVVSRKGKESALSVKMGQRPEGDTAMQPWHIRMPDMGEFFKGGEKKKIDAEVEHMRQEIERLREELKNLKKERGL
jgi:serine protease Do